MKKGLLSRLSALLLAGVMTAAMTCITPVMPVLAEEVCNHETIEVVYRYSGNLYSEDEFEVVCSRVTCGSTIEFITIEKCYNCGETLTTVNDEYTREHRPVETYLYKGTNYSEEDFFGDFDEEDNYIPGIYETLGCNESYILINTCSICQEELAVRKINTEDHNFLETYFYNGQTYTEEEFQEILDAPPCEGSYVESSECVKCNATLPDETVYFDHEGTDWYIYAGNAYTPLAFLGGVDEDSGLETEGVLDSLVCGESYRQVWICDKCGKETELETGSIAHEYETVYECNGEICDFEDVPCGASYIKKSLCGICKDVKNAEQLSIPHEYETVYECNGNVCEFKDIPCGADYVKKTVCGNCGDIKNTEQLSIPHEYETIYEYNGKTCALIDVPCGSTYLKKTVCKNCKDVKNAEPCDNPHPEETIKTRVKTKATTAVDGVIETYCENCGTVFAAQDQSIPAIDEAKTTLSAETFTYTGTAQKPTVTVRDRGNEIIPAECYSVTYMDTEQKASACENAGDYAVKIIFKGNYSGEITKSFAIEPKDIADTEPVLSQTSFTYSGTTQNPVVTIKGLVKDKDFTLDYSNNINAGTATVTIKGIGNYSGTVTKNYTIAKKAQTVTVTSSYSKIYGNAAFTISAKRTGDGVLKYASSNTAVATVSTAGKVTIKGVGTAKITVYAAASTNYNKSASKTVTITVRPKTAAIGSIAVGAAKMTVKMSTKPASTGGAAYQIAYRLSGTSKWVYTTTTSQSKAIAKLKKGKRYYVKVRAYKKVGSTTYYGAWSKEKLSAAVK